MSMFIPSEITYSNSHYFYGLISFNLWLNFLVWVWQQSFLKECNSTFGEVGLIYISIWLVFMMNAKTILKFTGQSLIRFFTECLPCSWYQQQIWGASVLFTDWQNNFVQTVKSLDHTHDISYRFCMRCPFISPQNRNEQK